MTRSGIESDLEKTPYVCSVNYGTTNVDYFFSSTTGLARFESQYIAHRVFVKESLEKRFKMGFYISHEFCDLQLYKKVESRGFRISIDGRTYKWLGELRYDGRKLVSKS